jgi:hypothetical protein
MIIIPKEKAWFGYDNSTYYYCFDKKNNEYDSLYYNVYELLSDVTVDKENKLHSYNDKPAIIIYAEGETYKRWFINGMSSRENTEKPFVIKKKSYYSFESGQSIFMEQVIENLNNIKNHAI